MVNEKVMKIIDEVVDNYPLLKKMDYGMLGMFVFPFIQFAIQVANAITSKDIDVEFSIIHINDTPSSTSKTGSFDLNFYVGNMSLHLRSYIIQSDDYISMNTSKNMFPTFDIGQSKDGHTDSISFEKLNSEEYEKFANTVCGTFLNTIRANEKIDW